MTELVEKYNDALSKIGARLPVKTSGGRFIDNTFDLMSELLAIQSGKTRVTFHPVMSDPVSRALMTRTTVDSVTYDASED